MAADRQETQCLVTVATLSCIFHILAALTLIVRRLYRGADMGAASGEASLETWTYSAVWAQFSAMVLWLGATRRSVVLRWTGLGLLLATSAKVFLGDMARLDGVIRAASFLGLGGVWCSWRWPSAKRPRALRRLATLPPTSARAPKPA